jgi:DNA-binding NarL/FixJ family response regulator
MRALLEAVPDMEVVGTASSGDEAVALADSLQPDVVLMDLQMPGLGGIEATRRVLAASPHIAVLVVTMFEDDYSVFTAMRAGARGYVLKDADEERRCAPSAPWAMGRLSSVRPSRVAWWTSLPYPIRPCRLVPSQI